MHCILCNRPVDLQTDLNTDENGTAVHENCDLRTLTLIKSSDTDGSEAKRFGHTNLGRAEILDGLATPRTGTDKVQYVRSKTQEKARESEVEECRSPSSGEGRRRAAAFYSSRH